MENFDSWIEEKKLLNNKKSFAFCHRREIWWCALGQNIGIEINGKHDNFERPVLILKAFNTEMIFVILMTPRKKSGGFIFPLLSNGEEVYAILTQARLISAKRLIRKISKIDPEIFKNLKNKYIELF